MIGAAGLAIIGVAYGIKPLLIAPVIYAASRVNRDVFLAVFSAYCIAIGYYFEVRSAYMPDSILALLVIALSAILMLDEGLRAKKYGKSDVLFLIALLASVVAREVILLTITIAVLANFYGSVSRRGAEVAIAAVMAVAAFVFLRDFIGVYGASSSQVSVIGALAILSMIPFWLRDRDRLDWTDLHFQKHKK